MLSGRALEGELGPGHCPAAVENFRRAACRAEQHFEASSSLATIFYEPDIGVDNFSNGAMSARQSVSTWNAEGHGPTFSLARAHSLMMLLRCGTCKLIVKSYSQS
jgi:hypothetical protein